jgi:hypothetical protein
MSRQPFDILREDFFYFMCSAVDFAIRRSITVAGMRNVFDAEATTTIGRSMMKFICLGYADMSKFAKMPETELKRAMDECFDYDDVLRTGGHFTGGEALQEPGKAITLRFVNGKVVATDGPYAETKEQLGGILILEADNMEHAVELMSKHPGVRTGPFEIRPADEHINALISARDTAIRGNQGKEAK